MGTWNIEITKRDDSTFDIDNGTISFMLPGYIYLLYGSLQQIFRNPRHATYKNLMVHYPTMEKIRECAECYKEGITNKAKFLSAIKDPKFISSYKLSNHDLTVLKEFIAKTNFAPPTINQQLHIKGYSRIVGKFIFADPMPELEETCEIFYGFVQELSKKKLS